jgi:hypothetical protein
MPRAKSNPLNGIRRETAEQKFQREIDFAMAVKKKRYPPWECRPILPPRPPPSAPAPLTVLESVITMPTTWTDAA